MWERLSPDTIETYIESLPMINHLPSVRIISRQEQLRDSLRILLTSLSRIGSVEAVSDVSSSLVEKEDAPPDLVLLALDSSDADSETLLTLRQIMSAWPSARTAVLVKDERQYRVVQTAGADVILYEGIIAAQLLKQVDELLPRADP
jgi:DNA-binding NarL/FixJ family response regulator